MVANWIRLGVPIPLESIHPHWKCLTDNAPVGRHAGETLEEIIGALRGMDASQQYAACQVLFDFLNPSQGSMNEPNIRENNRGRPRSQSDYSTRRDPCWFEISGDGSNSIGSGGRSTDGRSETPTSRVRSGSRGRGRGRGNVVRNILLDIYRGQWSARWGPLIGSFIDNVVDVTSDGHCGFRCIAALCANGESAWREVRRDLIRELEQNEALYATCWPHLGFVQDLIRLCGCFLARASEPHWLELPALAPVIASCYNVVVHSISATACYTYLPMRSSPAPMSGRGHITLGFVNGNHWVQVFWKEPHPIPPLLEMCLDRRLNIAQGWEDMYVTTME